LQCLVAVALLSEHAEELEFQILRSKLRHVVTPERLLYDGGKDPNDTPDKYPGCRDLAPSPQPTPVS